jgi:LysR family transcriptional regulator (chromosome initiation inhibitor)
MVPELQAAAGLATGNLVVLGHGGPIELPLYWQRWNLTSPVLDQLSSIITEEAAAALPRRTE